MYATLPLTCDLVSSSYWLKKLMPSCIMATWPCMKAAVTSYQLKLTTPGGANSRFIRAYHSTDWVAASLFSADLPSGVKYSPPKLKNWIGHWVMLAFFNPREHQPYTPPDGLWSALTACSTSSRLVGGLRPFASKRSLR